MSPNTMAGTNGEVIEEKGGYKNGGLLPQWPADQQSPNKKKSDDPYACGLGSFKPGWMQIFATKQVFLAVFCFSWVLQGAYYTYFVSVITTIEKLFQIQSKTTGLIMSATEIGQIGSSLLLSYYGGQGHRPRWIACGMLLFSLASFCCTLPHFLFGHQFLFDTYPAQNSLNICPLPGMMASNVTSPQCMEVEQSNMTIIVLSILFLSLIGVGLGQTAISNLGFPFIDDNVTSKESPLYFAITIGVKILGPAFGFILGSFCTRLYVDLSEPDITPDNPRWIGAWWLGLVIVSGLLVLMSLLMFCFPGRLKGNRTLTSKGKKVVEATMQTPKLKDFPKAIKRLLKNDILMFRTLSSVLHILPIAGLYTFLPKYLESQFRLTAHAANMYSGVGGILVMGVGIILSGIYHRTMKPKARFVAGWVAFTAGFYAIGMGSLVFVGCPTDDFAGLQNDVSSSFNMMKYEPVCTKTCDCDQVMYSPVCGADGLSYISACDAGCKNHTIKEGKIIEFSDCHCLSKLNGSSFERNVATVGTCDQKCDNFKWYIMLFSFFVFVHSTSEVGSMVLTMRCVEPTDKAMALGLITFAIGLFGNVPCPIVYGAVVDSACLIWDTACGKKGACKLYDGDFFRMFYHGTTSAFLVLAFFADIVVWYKAKDISIEDDEESIKEDQEEEELNPSRPTPETSV